MPLVVALATLSAAAGLAPRVKVRIVTYGALLLVSLVFGALGTYSRLRFAVLASSGVFVLAPAGKVAGRRFSTADRLLALAVLTSSPALAPLTLSRFGVRREQALSSSSRMRVRHHSSMGR